MAWQFGFCTNTKARAVALADEQRSRPEITPGAIDFVQSLITSLPADDGSLVLVACRSESVPDAAGGFYSTSCIATVRRIVVTP